VNNSQTSKLAIALASTLLAVACGGGGGGGKATPTATISGIAANSLLANATVCIDLNDNLQCDSGEPGTVTDSNGQFTLTGIRSSEAQDKYLIVEIGAATAGNSSPGQSNVLIRRLPVSIAASATLTAQSINPFTTLLAATDLSLAQLANALGVSEAQLTAEDYSADPVVKDFAALLAGKIADELAATVTSSAVNNASVLLTGGLLQDIADLLKTQSGATKEELQTALQSIEAAAPALDIVVNASLNVSASNAEGAPIQQVSVLVKAYLADSNTAISSTNGNALVIGETDSSGNVLVNLPQYDQPVIDVDVELQKEGFVTLTKRIKGIKAGNRVPLVLALSEENEFASAVGAGFDIPAATAASLVTGNPALTLALVRLPSGEQVILGGAAAAQAMASGADDVQVGVQIPLDRIGDNVTAINAGIQGFNPDKPLDAQSFPGSFEGVGSAENFDGDGIDSEYNPASAANAGDVTPIISTSFAQIRLQDQDGNEFELSAAEAGAANAEAPTIYIRVPESTYSTIEQDVNNDVSGIQVPIYVYRSGQGWVMVGLATLVKWDNGSYVEYADGLPLNTGIGQLYGRISITAGNDWVRWVNIDWPVIAGDVQVYDFVGRLHYQGARAERYNGYGYLEFDNGARQWLSISDGRLQYGQPTSAAAAGSAKLYLYNQYTYQYQAFPFAVDATAANTYRVDPDPGLLDNPFQCEVQGYLSKKGAPAAWHTVMLTAERFYRYTYSNANGEYKSVAPCNTLVKLTAQDSERQFIVDGISGGDETSDDNTLVRMLNIELPNQAPYVYGWADKWRLSIAQGGSADVTLIAYGFDSDSDSLSFAWTCPGAEASASFVFNSASRTCTVPASAVPDDVSLGYLPWSVTVTDSEGASRTYSSNIAAQVVGRNQAPRISSIQRDNRNLSCTRNNDGLLTCNDRLVEGAVAVYKVTAVDADGDVITYSSTTLTTLPGGENDGRFETTVSAGSNEHLVSVSDVRSGDDSRTATAKLVIEGSENRAPVVYMGVNKNRFIAGVDKTAVVTASLWDDNTTVEALRDNATVVLMQGGEPVDAAVNRQGNQWIVDLAGRATGKYAVRISVVDSLGAQTQASAAVAIENSRPPQISTLSGPAKLALDELNELVAPSTGFQAQVWDDSQVDQLDITAQLIQGEQSWALDVQQSGYTVSGDFMALAGVSLQPGEYILRLTVQDADNQPVARDFVVSIELPNNSVDIIIQ
jgi:hypothetical protein